MSELMLQATIPILTSPPLKIPRLGFGVFRSPPAKCVSSVLSALSAGYRQIDTAQFYGNEEQVGEAVRKSGLPRSEVFVTTKIANAEGSVEKTLEKLRGSVNRIGLGWVDLFLIHTPSGGPEARREMWEALERLKSEGGTKSIGVSNFGVRHIEQLKQFSSTIPAINQIELHPWTQQPEVVDYCKKEGIVIQAYSPLARVQRNDNPVLVSIASAHSVTPTQVLIRWSLQKGFVPLPKSDNPERIRANTDVFGFELTEQEMESLNGLGLPGGEGAVCPYLANCP